MPRAWALLQGTLLCWASEASASTPRQEWYPSYWKPAPGETLARAVFEASGPSRYAAVDESKIREILSKMTLEEKFLQTCIDTQCPESQASWFKCMPMTPDGKGDLVENPLDKVRGSLSSLLGSNESSSDEASPTEAAPKKASASVFDSFSPEAGDRAFELKSNGRLEITGFRMRDGPKGMTCRGFGAPCPEHGGSPAFPAQSLRAASWDVELEEEFGRAIGGIAERLQIHAALLPTINLLPWLHWGRSQESYGEDPVFSGKMGAGVVRGVQARGRVMATVKHFLANNIENTRWWVSAEMDDKILHEVFLKAWAIVVAESAPELVMTSYNRVQGNYPFAHPKFLDLLRGRLGFQGSVMTDWMATWEAITGGGILPAKGWSSPFKDQIGFLKSGSILGAGVDMEMPFCSKNRDLVAQIQACDLNDTEACAGRVALDKAVGRILRTKMRYGMLGVKPQPREPREYWQEMKYTHLALRLAQQGIVLLQNTDGFLPRPPAETPHIHIVLEEPWLRYLEVNEGDRGSSSVLAHIDAISVNVGIRSKYRNSMIRTQGIESIASAKFTSMTVIEVGYNWTFEGEFIPPDVGGDREYLSLHPFDIERIKAAKAVTDNIVVVIQSGHNVIVEEWAHLVKAILWMGYAGPMGGHALADILAGHVNPSGRLTSTTPKRAEDWLPASIVQTPFGFADPTIDLQYPYAFGFKHMWQAKIEPRYPIGWGLSYTTFEHGAPAVTSDGDTVKVAVEVRNTGKVNGTETVQVYVVCETCKRERLPIQLVAFGKARNLQPGEAGKVEMSFSAKDLAIFDPKADRWVLEAARYRILAGPHLSAPALKGAEYVVEAESSFDYALAKPDFDAFSRVSEDCSAHKCTPVPEEERIPGWALPTKRGWTPFLRLLQLLRLMFKPPEPLESWMTRSALALAVLLPLLCCCRCCLRCCCKKRAAVVAASTEKKES